MSPWEMIVGICVLVFSVLIIAVVLLQEGRQANLGAISGGADSFLSKNKARTIDAFLSKWTKIIAIVFFVLTILVNAVAIIKK